MRYRTKLFLFFVSLTLFAALLSGVTSYLESRKVLFRQIQSQILSIAVTTADSIDSDAVKKLIEAKGEGPEKEPLLDYLRKIRDANQRRWIDVHYLYLLKKREYRDEYDYLVDPDETDPGTFGDFFPTDATLLESQQKAVVDDSIVKDQWGEWLSAYAPIYDSEKRFVAMVGVDISAKFVHEALNPLIYYALITLAGSILVSVIVAYFLARLVTNSLHALVETVEAIGDGNLQARIHLETNDEFDELAFAINTMAKGLEERERLKSGFARYVSGYVLDRILKSDVPTNLAGERRKVTILFSDIRGFTQLSEHLPPEEVVSILNEYFEKMIEVIFNHHGTLDKFIGDGIMVEFGAPLEDEEQEKHAVQAAIEMQREVETLSSRWKAENRPEIHIGIGIHTGMAVVGNIGSEVRMEYTAIGDAVNVASRVEQATKEHQKKILVSSSTYEKIKDDFPFEHIGEAQVKGREGAVDMYAVDPHRE